MPNITPEVMRAFLEELEKCAFVPSAELTRGGIALGSGITGAAIGGLYQGKKRYSQARAEGRGVGGALGAGVVGGLKGGAIGGAIGAGTGGAFQGVGRTVRDFGGQTLLMWTGAGGAKGLEAFGGGAAATAKRLGGAEAALASAKAGTLADPRLLASWRKPIGEKGILDLAAKEHAHAVAAHAAMQRAQEVGITSLPGTVKALATRPGEAVRAAWGAAADGTTNVQKALVLGIPGGIAAHGAIRKPKEGETRLGNAVGGLAGAAPLAMPWMPSSMLLSLAPGIPNVGMSASAALGKGGKTIGDAVQRTVAPGTVQPAVPPSDPALTGAVQ